MSTCASCFSWPTATKPGRNLVLTAADLRELSTAADALFYERVAGGGTAVLSLGSTAALIKHVLVQRKGSLRSYLIAAPGDVG